MYFYWYFISWLNWIYILIIWSELSSQILTPFRLDIWRAIFGLYARVFGSKVLDILDEKHSTSKPDISTYECMYVLYKQALRSNMSGSDRWCF